MKHLPRISSLLPHISNFRYRSQGELYERGYNSTFVHDIEHSKLAGRQGANLEQIQSSVIPTKGQTW